MLHWMVYNRTAYEKNLSLSEDGNPSIYKENHIQIVRMTGGWDFKQVCVWLAFMLDLLPLFEGKDV